MRREDCEELFAKIPQVYHAQLNLILRGQGMITVDVLVRFEPHYVVLRGREQGSTDEGRAFFVPYEEIAYFRLERVVKLGEIKAMYGETGRMDAEDALLSATEKADVDPANETSAGMASKTLRCSSGVRAPGTGIVAQFVASLMKSDMRTPS